MSTVWVPADGLHEDGEGLGATGQHCGGDTVVQGHGREVGLVAAAGRSRAGRDGDCGDGRARDDGQTGEMSVVNASHRCGQYRL